MPPKILLNVLPDANINNHERASGLTPLHIAVKNLSITDQPSFTQYSVIGCIQRGANVNAHQRGNNITPLDFLLINAINSAPCNNPQKISFIAKLLLENGAKVNPVILGDLMSFLAVNKMPGQCVTIDRETRNSLWMTVTFCLHFGASIILNHNNKHILFAGIELTSLSIFDAIANAAILRQYNIAIQYCLIEDAMPVAHFTKIGKVAKDKVAAEISANLENCVPGTTPEQMHKAAMTIQFAMLRNMARVAVIEQKELIEEMQQTEKLISAVIFKMYQ